MYSIKAVFYFSLFTLVSCNSSLPKVGYSEEACIEETNTKYRNIASLGKTVYKLEKIHDDGLIVSVWHGNDWYYQGKKDRTIFHDTPIFKYKDTNCPDNKGADASLSSRLKQLRSN